MTWLKTKQQLVWGPAMLTVLLATGVFLTVRLSFLPWRNLKKAVKMVFEKPEGHKAGDISPFQALMTSLAATIGTGNIVGVALAMGMGGPGALVWMWISALFGLSTKFTESVLAVLYRVKKPNGEMAGGPMYVLRQGFPFQRMGAYLAAAFALCTIAASFGIGNMTQANSMSGALSQSFGVPVWLTGAVGAVLAALVLVGGIRSIGKISGVLVPVMAVLYLVFGLVVILVNLKALPAGLSVMIRMAFSPAALTGGAGGMVAGNLWTSLQYGVSRGVFSNEAGLGSGGIAAAAAQTDQPVRQGYISMTATFFDTLVLCTVTGLVICCSGVLNASAGAEALEGVGLSIAAFASVWGPYGRWVVSVGMALFAFATIIGWAYYGEKAVEYFCDAPACIFLYRLLFAAMVYVGAVSQLHNVWLLSDLLNGMMMIPNLLCLWVMHGVVVRQCRQYQKILRKQRKKR